MTALAAPTPVLKSIVVNAPPARAFEAFTAGMGRWWLPTHSIGTAPLQAVVVEPRAGGRWFERGTDGSECDWGRVLVWEPPARLVLSWQLDADWRFDPALVTEVELRFLAEGTSATRVELEHRGLDRFGARAEQARAALDSAQGWTALLDAFAASTGERPAT